MLPEDPRLPNLQPDATPYLRLLNQRLNDLFRQLARAINTKSIFGTDGINYSEFEEDGTLVAYGNATCYRDELNDLLKTGLNNPAARIEKDLTESCLIFKTTATTEDWAAMNVQINHDWKAGSSINPHIHWWQAENNTPNWMIQYRWQKECGAKTTGWTSKAWTANTCDYTTGTINQITSFGLIDPPTGYGLSDILQIRFIRDSANASTLFDGADPYTANASATSADVHIEIDTLGSRATYSK